MNEISIAGAAPTVFRTEAELQALAHTRPELILAGIPEIDPRRCPDTPSLHSLGREIALLSGPIDNLYVDVNSVLTFVECKRYGDSRLKREVYPQAVNYASDLQATLLHYQGDQFIVELERVLQTAKFDAASSFGDIVERVSKDRLLEGRNLQEWKRQFRDRLEFNIKNGIFRVIVLCGPSPADNFSYSAVRNLIRLMQFTERNGSRYDLLLMDIRHEGGDFRSSIIWRRYAELPQIPLIAQYVRDASIAAESLAEARDRLPEVAKQGLATLLEALRERGVLAEPTSKGYTLRWVETGKSLYATLSLSERSWIFTRYQIKANQPLHQRLTPGLQRIGSFDGVVSERKSASSHGPMMYQIDIEAPEIARLSALADLVVELGRHSE